MRLEYLAGATAVSLVIPGVLEFSSDTASSGSNITIADITRYATGFNPADSSLGYTLPNDASVYTDENGRVLRIVSSGGTTYDFTNYLYAVNGSGQLIITLVKEGVSVNLATGELTVLASSGDDDSNAGFELYLGWDMFDGWFTGEGRVQIDTKYENIMGEDDDGNPVEYVVTNQALWKTVNGVSYYLVYDSRSEIWNTGTSHTYYVIGIDSYDHVVAVYKAKRDDHETSEVTAIPVMTFSSSDGVLTVVTTYALTFSNFAGSGATLKYVKEVTTLYWTDSEGDEQSSSSTRYYYSINLGLSMEWVDSYLRLQNKSGLTGSALTAYNVLQGVIWKKDVTKDSDDEFKGRMDYWTIDKTDDILLSTITEEDEEGEEYSYVAFVFDKSGDRREWAVYDEYDYYTAEGVEYEIDLKAFTLELTSDGWFGFTISGGGNVTLLPGESVTLYEDNNIYRVTRNLFIGKDGTVYFDGVSSASGVFTVANATGYNGYDGTFESSELIISDTDDGHHRERGDDEGGGYPP